jgi:hypothetical protein
VPTRMTLNRKALLDIMRGDSGKLRKLIDDKARRIAAAAGPDYETQGREGRFRYRGTVRSKTPTNVAKSPLLRAVDAGRDV